VPLRTLVLNVKDPNVLTAAAVAVSSPSAASSVLIANTTSTVPFSVAYAAQLHKQHFAHVQFKCLSFEELAQHAVITRATDELTLILLKQLDERASTVINAEQREAFTKNQVRLVKKYLEQQHQVKGLIRSRIVEQLGKDQKQVLEPEYRTPFLDKTEAIKRLSRYHVLQKTYHEPTEEEAVKCKRLNIIV
jgi:hypothetical protein